MTIVADCGSTKTSWALVETGEKIVTEGLNPHFTSDEQFLAACNLVRERLACEDNSIFFYGSGCGSAKQRKRVTEILAKAFGTNEVYVDTDMLGACRATAGDSASIVGILGTGSNACFYDGKKIALQPFSTGYILGDEGSANFVGRYLLKEYLTDNMPELEATLFHKAFPLSKEEMMELLYHQPNPNRWLASLATITKNAQEDTYFYEVQEESINAWKQEQVMPLCEASGCTDLYIVGGFAESAKRAITACFRSGKILSTDIVLKKIVDDPIDGLIDYHSKDSKKS